MVAFHVYIQIFALPSSLDGVRAEIPFSVQRVYRVPDLLSQHSLSRFVTQHGRGEFHVDLEHPLGRFRCRTRGIDGRMGRIRGGPPETFGSARVELRNLLREPQSRVAGDLAHLELSAGTPVLALLLSSDRIRERRTEFGCNDDETSTLISCSCQIR